MNVMKGCLRETPAWFDQELEERPGTPSAQVGDIMQTVLLFMMCLVRVNNYSVIKYVAMGAEQLAVS